MFAMLHESFVFDHQLLSLGNAAFGVYARALAYSAGQLSDGFLPSGIVTALDPSGEIAKKFVAAKLWLEVEGGFQIEEWGRRQKLKSQVLREREATKDRVNKHRSKDCNGVTDTVTNGVGNAHSEGRRQKAEAEKEKESPSETPSPSAQAPPKKESPSSKPETEKPKKDYANDPKVLRAVESWNALAAESGGRIATVTAADLQTAGWATIQKIELGRKAHPDLTDWRSAGQMYQSGFEAFRTDLGISLVVRNGWLAGALSAGVSWASRGRPGLVKGIPVAGKTDEYTWNRSYTTDEWNALPKDVRDRLDRERKAKVSALFAANNHQPKPAGTP